MRDRNAINFADDVRAPVLFLIGRNDSRCPYRQAMLYVERLEARDHPHEVYVFETGHGSFDVDERVRQARTILDFLAATCPALARRRESPLELELELVREVGQDLGAVLGNEGEVFEPDAAEALPVEPRLDGDHVTGDEPVVAEPADVRLLVHLETDAVAGPWKKPSTSTSPSALCSCVG